ncbi:MAG: type II toxin-antitoxin system death-on-curing family toxin [Saprospiraceae bacterium]|jgi:death-on-curing protein|nr:type II toxin-antitoxin system death-on-curing family toxin [Saprospiraceae bacterium]MBK7372976.1 type II toxin-antitoxin system death-on-curing family toxin [Saprospiraceae bacterium]MBK7439702.1 type II toxin-antitoxin system death-on-curing family toxin [Saprospiraceae bacterium]MBK9681495.1 type II toxin-antitoxin system death-on-curing family toxin [Saprospiraceae bacterium]MBL0110647.1 type II toxin-antitoxin system death-on-curing family toxin [Saprospiraceae bacterium]
MIYLDKEDIIFINKSTIETHGGNYLHPYNFLHEENLDYLLEAIQAEMFDQPIYPLISDKAALYCFNIICNHIFSDGNKRTGLEAALAFLKLNAYQFKSDLSNKELILFILSVASGEISLDECRTWFASNTIPLTTRRKGPDEKH